MRLAVTDFIQQEGLVLGLPECHPTRFGATKASCLDHFWISERLQTTASGTLRPFSDHCGVFCSIRSTRGKHASGPPNPPRLIKTRKIKSVNEAVFATDLSSSILPVPTPGEDPTNYCNRLFSPFMSVLDRHAPEVTIKVRDVKREGLPKLPKRLADLSREKDKLLRWKQQGRATEDTDRRISDLKKQIRRESRRFIYGHYRKRLAKHKGDMRKTWEILREFLPNSSSSSADSGLPAESADLFNKAFASVGAKIAAETAKSDFSRPPPKSTFTFTQITPKDIVEASKRMTAKATTGPDGVPNCLLKLAAPIMAPQLAALFNLSIKQGKIPEKWQSATVTPIYKSGDRNVPENYRPISITSCVLKLMERCIAEQLKQHIKFHHFLRLNQFGFRARHNCESCLLKIVDDCKRALDRRECVGLVCLDLSKAFDSLPVEGLLSALTSAGLDHTAIQWFQSYLSSRKQRVKIGNSLSNTETVSFGVPQGSILGPLLFVIFINELPAQCQNSEVSLFADDTTIVAWGKTPEEVEVKLQHDLERVNNWLHVNCLKTNKEKSNFMFISQRQDQHLPAIKFGDVSLPALSTVKILGFLLDSKLTMTSQTDAVVKKARSGTYALRLASRYVDLNTRRIIFDSIVGCHFNYCDAVLGQAGKTDLDRLQVAHNKAVRAVAKVGPRCSAAQIRVRLGWLDLDGKRRVHMATTVWRCLYDSDSSEALSSLLVRVNQVHGYATRGATSGKLFVSGVRTVLASRSFASRAVAWWNGLPLAAREATSSTQCRNIVYHELLDKASKALMPRKRKAVLDVPARICSQRPVV